MLEIKIVSTERFDLKTRNTPDAKSASNRVQFDGSREIGQLQMEAEG